MILRAGLAVVAAVLLASAAAVPEVNGARLLDPTPAPKLSDYGLFGPGRTPAAGMTLYTLNTPLFSDYAEKFRWVYMPAGTKARYTPTGVLEFPVGTTLVKTFAFPADFRQPDKDIRIIETRLLVRRETGWVPLSYVWNAEGTDAVLKRAGVRVPVSFIDTAGKTRAIDYAVPNVNQCKQCHQVGAADMPIGPTAANLNGGVGGHGPNQLQAWAAAGRLEGLPPLATVPKMARWDDPGQPLAARARAYMDVNCGHCHSPKGFASNSGLYLQTDEPDPAHQGIYKRPVAAGRGSGGLAFSITPGNPDASILVHRMESSEPGVMMPQFGRTVTHDEGVALVRAYVESLPVTKAPAPGR
jgi:uncharacterized repeat protein (TIGR03806 family)